MKRVGLAIAGAVLATGMAGGTGFAVRSPHVPTPGPTASTRHCAKLQSQIQELFQDEAATHNTARQAALQRQALRIQGQWIRQCT